MRILQPARHEKDRYQFLLFWFYCFCDKSNTLGSVSASQVEAARHERGVFRGFCISKTTLHRCFMDADGFLISASIFVSRDATAASPIFNQNVFFSSRLWVHEVIQKKKKHIEGVLFTSGDSGVIVGSHLGKCLGGGRIETKRCHVFVTSPELRWGLLGTTGSWSKSWFDPAVANEREKGLVRFFLLCIILGPPIYLSSSFVFLSLFFLFSCRSFGSHSQAGRSHLAVVIEALLGCLVREERFCSPSQASGVTAVLAMT